MFFHMPQAAAEGVQTLLPVYVFDREKFNTPTLAGEESENSREKERERERENIGTIKTQRFAAIDVHLVRGCQRRCADLGVFGAEVLAKAVLAGLAFSWKVCSACGATLKRRAQDWQLHWVHHKRHASVSCCLCVLEFTKLKLWKTDREQGLVTKRSGYSKALQWLGQSYRYQGIWLGGHMRSNCRQRKMSILANCLLESQSSSK